MNSMTQRLKEAIASSKLSFQEIEEKLELEAGSVERFVSGKDSPDTETLNRICSLIGESSNYILFGSRGMGEMKAMFPNEVTPEHTPMSDWRFLVGVILTFTGACGLLLMVMRYAAEGISVAQIMEKVGIPAVILAVMAGVGLIICAVSTFLSLRIPKSAKKKGEKNEKE